MTNEGTFVSRQQLSKHLERERERCRKSEKRACGEKREKI